MFREKDMGNLVQLLFTCGDYFRGKDIELVTDSHFGHMVPIAYLRLLKVYVTSSFSQGSRIGISNIRELSRKKYTAEELKSLKEQAKLLPQEEEKKFDPLAEPSSEEEIKPYEKPKVKKSRISVKTPLQLYEKNLSKKPRGKYEVWKSSLLITKNFNVVLYLHAINDSKPVFRISSKYGALPAVPMNLTNEKKTRQIVHTSAAHESFRKKMGNNDQSDAKRSVFGLSSRYYRQWPKHTLAKVLEDAVINSYLNYLLDPGCSVEPWPVFLFNLVQELLDSGDNLRATKVHRPGYKRFRGGRLKRPRAGSDQVLDRGSKCKGGLKGIKKLGTKKRTAQCAFCGREKAKFKCRACDMHLCMDQPKDSLSGITYPANGPPCFLRLHGINTYTG